MSASAVAHPEGESPTTLASASGTGRFALHYVKSPLFDAVFFLAPFWVSLLYVALIRVFPAYDALIFILSYILLAETHFASTWPIYLDARNREEYAKRRAVFYVMPLVVIVGSVLFAWQVNFKALLLFGAAVSGWHAARQSVGMLALYRGKAKEFDGPKQIENWALYLAFAFFLGYGFLRFYAQPGASYGFVAELVQPLRPLAWAGVAALGIGALVLVARVAAFEARRYREGGTVSLSKLIVFSYSLFFYSPYVFASRMEHAIAMSAGIHYLQYLGIVWLLNRNKYREIAAGEAPARLDRRILVGLSQRLWLRVPYLCAYALVMALLRQGGFHWDRFEPSSWLYSIPVGLQIVHYYLDAYIWRFSNPYIRSTVVPYLTNLDRPAAPLAAS